MDFINLHNHTEYSLLDGMISPEELIEYAVENDQPGIAMTDHGAMGGFYKVYNEAKEHNIKPLLGCEFYVVTDINFKENREKGEKEHRYHLTAIAKNLNGLRNLFELVTKGQLEGFYYRPRICLEWIEEYKDDIVWMSGCMAGPVAKLGFENKYEKALKQARRLDTLFEDFYLEIMPNKIHDQKVVNPVLVRISEETGIPLVATTDAHYLEEQQESHKVLLGINSGGEMWEFDDDCFHLMTGEEMYDLMKRNHPSLPDRAIKESIKNTVEVYEKVEDFELKEYDHVIPRPYPELETKEDEFEFLKEKVEEGWEKKNMLDKKELPEYQERLERELKSIWEQDFVRYFLVVYDLYENCVKPKNIMYGTGRGSSAGSLVSCLLNITDPDPIEHDLIFERFIAPNRVTSPDIDMDFQRDRRDEIKEYLYEKYGYDNSADIGTYGTLKGKQVLRDVCRVLDVPRGKVDKLSQFIIQRSGGDERSDATVVDTFKEFDEAKKFNRQHPEVLPHCKNLEGRIRQSGIHAAGVVVAPFKLTEAMPLERRSGGVRVTALDGKEIDAMGFLKLDILGLKTLTIIKDTIDQIGLTRDDLVRLDYNDQKVFDKFGKGDTEGVFQFSSVGLSDTLKEMPVDDFDDLVALNALYRPGGMRSGITGEYIERKKGADWDEVGNVYDEITKDTYGLIVYQEQIMKIFGQMAGYDLTNIDHMRKRVAKAHGVEEFAKQKPKFIEGCVENGIDKNFADEIFDKMIHFGSYAFNRAHALVYTQMAYWCQWLKVYYPVEFYVASLNNEDQDDKIRRLLGQLEREGYELLLPHINKSQEGFTVEDGKIRIGLRYIKGIGEKTAKEIVKHQPYKDEEDIQNREGINRRVFHRGVRRILREVEAWKDNDEYTQAEMEVLREELAEELMPLPILDKEIQKAKDLARHYDCDFTEIEDLTFERNQFVYLRGVFSGINYARVGDFGPPSPYSKWEIGDRYAMMDIEDGSGHIRIKFNPEKYEEYKDKLRIGKKVLIHGRIIKDIKMVFIDFLVELTEEKVQQHLKKYG